MTRDIWSRWLLAAGVALLATACSTLGPDEHAPHPTAAAAGQAALPPQDRLTRLLDWWQQLDDPVLRRLLTLSEQQHPTLDSALAAIDRARADAGHERQAARPLRDARWERDLRHSEQPEREAASTRQAAEAAPWHDARVSLAAELASHYVDYRACQLQNTLTGHQRLSPPDVRAARATRPSTDDTAAEPQAANCRPHRQALLTLSGTNETALQQLLDSQPAALPDATRLAVGRLPLDQLRQRPDLIAAAPPLAANRDAPEAQRYQQALHHALQEAEQAWQQLNHSQQDEAIVAERHARQQQALAATVRQWHNGGASAQALDTALRNSLRAEQDWVSLRRERLHYTLALYKALGGGWATSATTGASRYE